MAAQAMDPEDRFRTKVQVGPDCWLWTAGRDRDGYGQFWLRGRVESAHRAAWEFRFGSIPEGKMVLHRCDTPACVRPEHLFLGDAKANHEDMVMKGRRADGQVRASEIRVDKRNALGVTLTKAKLGPEQVEEIRARYAAGGVTQAALGRDYGVNWRTIHVIVRNRNWKHILPK
jgi:hypothetical protein